MASIPNVFPQAEKPFPGALFGRPSRRCYRSAVKQVVLEVKARYSLTSEDLAERVGVSKDTIENAENEASSLEAVTLLSIAFCFGEEAIEPVRALYLGAPVEQPSAADDLTRAQRLIDRARQKMDAA